MSARWLRITSTSLDVSTDGEYLRWTLPVDAVEWLACELHPDGASRELCDNCGSPLVVVRSREGRFCTSECAEAFRLS